ncbi:unnamed protein product [Ectocarpus sp. 8 AP-2014]
MASMRYDFSVCSMAMPLLRRCKVVLLMWLKRETERAGYGGQGAPNRDFVLELVFVLGSFFEVSRCGSAACCGRNMGGGFWMFG